MSNFNKEVDISKVVADPANPWTTTRRMLREYVNYTGPMTYSDWLSLPDYIQKKNKDGVLEKIATGNKAAVLFLQFYEQITLAWYKTKSYYAMDEDGVSTVLQYLEKNVQKIKDSPKRFTPAYIYKVAYNCLYCICHDIQRDKLRAENEMSNIQPNGSDGEELDWFDSVCDTRYDMVDEICRRDTFHISNEIWDMIEDMGVPTKKVVAKLMKENSYIQSELDSISSDTVDRITQELRVKLAPYLAYYTKED